MLVWDVCTCKSIRNVGFVRTRENSNLLL